MACMNRPAYTVHHHDPFGDHLPRGWGVLICLVSIISCFFLGRVTYLVSIRTDVYDMNSNLHTFQVIP
jgi:hypothetical protein